MRVGARGLRLTAGVTIASVALALSGCGAAALPPPPAPPGNTAQLDAGKSAFSSTCGSCHALTAAGTRGAVGPGLDHIGSLHDAAWIVAQMQNPCAPGHANAAGPKYSCVVMPKGMASGPQAQAIAAYLASQK